MPLEFPELNLANYCATPTPPVPPALPASLSPFPSCLQARSALAIIRDFVDEHEDVARLFRPAAPRQPIHELWAAANRMGRYCLAGGSTRDTYDQVAARVCVVDALIDRVSKLTHQEWATVLGCGCDDAADCCGRPLEWVALLTEAQYDRLAALH
jgi:hypothetical protein